MSVQPEWLWLLVAVAMIVIELLTGTFMFLLFAAAAALAALAAFLGLGTTVQAGVFLAGVVGACCLAPRLAQRARRKTPDARFGVDALLDQTAVVIEAIDPVLGTGTVKVGGETWRARAPLAIPVGARVRVGEVSGTRLVVYPEVGGEAGDGERLVETDPDAATVDTRRTDDG